MKKKRRDQIVTHDPLGFANWTSGVVVGPANNNFSNVWEEEIITTTTKLIITIINMYISK